MSGWVRVQSSGFVNVASKQAFIVGAVDALMKVPDAVPRLGGLAGGRPLGHAAQAHRGASLQRGACDRSLLSDETNIRS
jgi:hypothetical protein